MSLEQIQLQIAFGAVKHFGRNLYTSNPPAIAELIANSWDAYCTECNIYYNTLEEEGCMKTSLLISDDGIGMTDDELENKYAVSGKEKIESDVRIPSGFDLRPYMGRKGIGKFSAFSLGDTYVLYTKSDQDDKWKKVLFQYELLLANDPTISIDVDYIDDLSELKEEFPDLNENSTGTVIHIPLMRRKIISSSIESLQKLISRRFSVNVIKSHNFNLRINSNLLDLSQHFYDSNLEFIYYFGLDLEGLKDRFPSIAEENFYLISDEFLDSNSVNGWLGTVEVPRQLLVDSDSNSSVSGVVVYINGKLADEDILRGKLKNRITNSYFLGEVNADFLQNEEEDPVLSSREGLNRENPNVKDLIVSLSNISDRLIREWNDLRSNRSADKLDFLKNILDSDQVLGKAFELYNSKQQENIKKLAQRVFDNDENYSEGEYRVYGNAIFSLINNNVINEITIDRSIDDAGEILRKFYNLFEKTELNAALRIKSNLDDRLSVIKKLEGIIDAEEIESVFENHLAKNPWLINQYWDKPSNEIVVETQNRYREIIRQHEEAGRTDIIIKTADEPFPIICELKREKATNYSMPDVINIRNQISLYRDFIMNELEKDNDQYTPISIFDIKAYFICGDSAKAKLGHRDFEFLKNDKIELKTYQEIIRYAERVYSHRVKVDE